VTTKAKAAAINLIMRFSFQDELNHLVVAYGSTIADLYHSGFKISRTSPIAAIMQRSKQLRYSITSSAERAVKTARRGQGISPSEILPAAEL
jgi:hypothetical protein